MPRGRYVNLAELGDEDRENKLETKTVEYLVHGLFARSEKEMGENKNGRHGAWWVDLDKILATIAADDLKQKLQAFEEAQKATRDEAIAAAMERKEEAAAADDSCSCHVHVSCACVYRCGYHISADTDTMISVIVLVGSLFTYCALHVIIA